MPTGHGDGMKDWDEHTMTAISLEDKINLSLAESNMTNIPKYVIM